MQVAKKIAFVPTMGALHEGHLALFREGKRRGDFLVVSLFVNPTQFNDPKDFEHYPRLLEQDLEKCRQEKVDRLFTPTLQEIYPDGLKIDVKAGPVAQRFEGASRPGHFDGVATVVAKLFRIVRPDVAIFGEKDFQQLLVIREMTRRLGLPVEIIGHPTIRTAEGVAMSSRNALLSPKGYKTACVIPRALNACQKLFAEGERSTAVLEHHLKAELERGTSLKIDYARVVDAETLETVKTIDRPAVALIAVFVEGIRLIDNTRLDPLQSGH